MSGLTRRFKGRFDAWGQQRATEVGDRIEDLFRAEMRELTRMLRQQGDAADELAETFGRTLARLSVAIESLQARLDRLEAAASAEPGPSAPAEPR